MKVCAILLVKLFLKTRKERKTCIRVSRTARFASPHSRSDADLPSNGHPMEKLNLNEQVITC